MVTLFGNIDKSRTSSEVKTYYVDPVVVNKEENTTNFTKEQKKEKIFIGYFCDKMNSKNYWRRKTSNLRFKRVKS